jgi:hypothetical protein
MKRASVALESSNLNVTTIQKSGTKENLTSHLTERSSPELRRCLCMAAGVARQCDKELHKIYESRRKRGKSYTETLITIAQNHQILFSKPQNALLLHFVKLNGLPYNGRVRPLFEPYTKSRRHRWIGSAKSDLYVLTTLRFSHLCGPQNLYRLIFLKKPTINNFGTSLAQYFYRCRRKPNLIA